MGEGKKIIVEHYPAERLPEDLRRAFGGAGSVRVTVEPDASGAAAPASGISSLFGVGKGCYTEVEAVSSIRLLRDES